MLMIIIILVAARLVVPAAAILADQGATLVAAFYWARLERLTRLLIGAGLHDQTVGSVDPWKVDSVQRLALACHLRHAIRMTAYFGCYPEAPARGYTLAQKLGLIGR